MESSYILLFTEFVLCLPPKPQDVKLSKFVSKCLSGLRCTGPFPAVLSVHPRSQTRENNQPSALADHSEKALGYRQTLAASPDGQGSGRMTPERSQQIRDVLEKVLELAPEQHSVFLDRACSSDLSLRREVENLLASGPGMPPSFLQSSLRVALTSGTKLGDYEVKSLLGSGGMGEVYRARDSRLGRDVAIKVLPSFFSGDSGRLRRFEQEARAAAALNHPNILAVFQMGTYQGASYLVSELLEGETLREPIKRGRLTVRKAIDYGVQLARGLAAAHEKGIVHRDLKPENLFITKDGRLKILDFGLAKLMPPESGSDGTAVTLTDGTAPGAVLGTVGYMSPEQVRGQTTDYRTDIFACGAILYEMLAGKRAFQKSTAVETMTAILNEDPPGISQVTTNVPAGLQRVVHRCLEKNQEQRFQSASDLAFALGALSDSGWPTPHEGSFDPVSEFEKRKLPSKIGSKPLLMGIAAVVVSALVAAVMLWGVYRNFFEHSRQPFQLPMRRLTSTEKSRLAACSPDGKYLVHVVQEGDLQSLWLVDVGSERNMQIVAPDQGRYQGLVFSADSQNVYYSESIRGSGALYQVPIFGGSPRKLIGNVSSSIALSWDGKQFAFLRPAGDETTLFVAAATLDGNERSVCTGRFFGGPAWSPDGKTIALLAGTTGSPIADLVEVPTSGGPERLISREDWSYNGRIAWLRNGSGLVLQASDPAFNTQLWLVSYPGGGRQRITNDLAKYESVTATADSKTLTTIRTDDVSTIWIAAPGGAARQMTFDGPKHEGKGGVVWTRRWQDPLYILRRQQYCEYLGHGCRRQGSEAAHLKQSQ